MKSSKTLILIVIAGLIGLLYFPIYYANAQEKPEGYPERQIELILGAGAGGGTDIFSRTIAIGARRILKVPMVVINIPAAGGAECMAELQSRPADGYTLMAINPVQIIAYVMKRSPFGPDSFAPIINCQRDVLMLLVRAKSPFQSIDDLLKYARENPRKLTIGGTGAGGFDEVMSALFAKAAGVQTKYIPFDSGSEMHSQLLGGHIDAMLDEPGPTASLLDANKIRVLLAFAEDRLKAFPEVPSSVERGWDITLGAWRGIAAKAGTSPKIIAYLHQVFKKSMEHRAYQAIEKSSYLHLRPGYLTPEQFKQLLEKELEVYSNTLKDLGYIK
jgi:putative tricarboxylic transport membrane protein